MHLIGSAYLFRLRRASYTRTCLLGWLSFTAFALVALVSIVILRSFWPTYSHTFTLYLKWPDALVLLIGYAGVLALSGAILVLRFLYVLSQGQRREILRLEEESTMTVRDLSIANLAAIFWSVGTPYVCFIVAVVGLLPSLLFNWAFLLPAGIAKILACLFVGILSLAGLCLTVPALGVTFIGWLGWRSNFLKIGSPCTYQISSQTAIMLDGGVLSIVHPNKPEAIIDLNLFDPEDQRHLLFLLQKCLREFQANAGLVEQIEELFNATGEFLAVSEIRTGSY